MLLRHTLELPAHEDFFTRVQEEKKSFISNPGPQAVWGLFIHNKVSVPEKRILLYSGGVFTQNIRAILCTFHMSLIN